MMEYLDPKKAALHNDYKNYVQEIGSSFKSKKTRYLIFKILSTFLLIELKLRKKSNNNGLMRFL
jgi:hypothetical protein